MDHSDNEAGGIPTLRRPRARARAALAVPYGAIERIRIHVLRALARYLAQPLKGCDSVAPAEQRCLAAVLDRGDVLLTDGNTRGAALVRRMTRSMWSHVAMYVGPLEQALDPLCIVEADIAAGVRSIRLSELNALRIRVLRPASLNDTERSLLADSVVNHIGSEYDLSHAWRIARSLLAPGRKAPTPPAREPVSRPPRRFICSSLVAHAFTLLGYSIWPSEIAAQAGGAGGHANLTPADFEHAPVFQVVWPTGAADPSL